jgi:hypothetical protein
LNPAARPKCGTHRSGGTGNGSGLLVATAVETIFVASCVAWTVGAGARRLNVHDAAADTADIDRFAAPAMARDRQRERQQERMTNENA